MNDGFYFLFEAFILLMGLAMAQVLGGFARVLKLRARQRAGVDGDKVHIGWLTPLLGLFVIVDQSTFFLHMFSFRESMPFNGGTVLGILLTIGWYYLVASMTFPDKPEDWPDFDAWFWQQKRFVVGGVIGINVISMIANTFYADPEAQAAAAASMPPILLVASLLIVLVFPAIIWLFFSKSARACIALMVFVNVLTLVYGALVIGSPQPF